MEAKNGAAWFQRLVVDRKTQTSMKERLIEEASQGNSSFIRCNPELATRYRDKLSQVSSSQFIDKVSMSSRKNLTPLRLKQPPEEQKRPQGRLLDKKMPLPTRTEAKPRI